MMADDAMNTQQNSEVDTLIKDHIAKHAVQPTIAYALSFENVGQHLIDVVMTFTAQAHQELWLPAWVPGSYLIREFSRHVSTPVAKSIRNNLSVTKSIFIEKISKNHWRLDTAAGEHIEIRYQVYAFDLSVRGAYLDQTRAYANPACICLAVAGQEHQSILLTIDPGSAFANLPIACSLDPLNVKDKTSQQNHETHHKFHFEALNYTHLIDHPFEIAAQTLAQFEVSGIPHQIAISGRHRTNIKRLTEDLLKICRYEIEFFGSAPFPHYLFMVMATGSSYGGLEHQDCTSLITPREDLPQPNEPEQPSASYRRFLGLCSHEYFHSWLVKFIRPQEFAVLDLGREVYTRMLWVFEGFTSYYDDLILYRSGVIDQKSYLELLAEQLTRYLQNTGRAHQSVSDSSFDAWIKYYRPDENSQNASTSYYNKGALIALCLDLKLRANGSSLDVIMVKLYELAQQGLYLNTNTLPDLCEALIGDRLTDFWSDFVDGTVELPVVELLSEVGVKTHLENKTWPLGLKVVDSSHGLLIQQVLRNSVGAQAGLSAQDVLIAIEGIRASSTLLNHWADVSGFNAEATLSTGESITCHVFRRDELMAIQVKPVASVIPHVSFTVEDTERSAKWL
ncbi:M61 family metallopeptidase [Aquirhabdus parva]|uniref:M61 family peptidase n=1 Tax=Aquirhabdus parva TaxID=2283318 RepID=A0A345P5F7_9GAMM|nr:M61 family metallopeptidase [Aquirhabdus parva]AXI02516.1 M61 family peptidase [Aquirhabdus parva]